MFIDMLRRVLFIGIIFSIRMMMLITIRMFRYSMPSCLDNIGGVVNQILKFVENYYHGISEGSVFELKVILNELLFNAVKHGNKFDSNKEVRICVLNSSSNVIQIVIRDCGAGFDYTYVTNNRQDHKECDNFFMLKESGRGLLIVKSLCHSIRFNKKGNLISVTKKL